MVRFNVSFVVIYIEYKIECRNGNYYRLTYTRVGAANIRCRQRLDGASLADFWDRHWRSEQESRGGKVGQRSQSTGSDAREATGSLTGVFSSMTMFVTV